MRSILRFLALHVCLCTAAACATDGGLSSGRDGDNKDLAPKNDTSDTDANAATRYESRLIEPGELCTYGGVLYVHGVDSDGDGSLQDEDVIEDTHVCLDQAPPADPLTPEEPAVRPTGVRVTAPTTTLLDEAGERAATFTIALNSHPTAAVTVSLSFADTTLGCEGVDLFELSTSEVEFTGANYTNEQSVRVVGLENWQTTGALTSHLVLQTSSEDPYYDGISLPISLFVLQDDDCTFQGQTYGNGDVVTVYPAFAEDNGACEDLSYHTTCVDGVMENVPPFPWTLDRGTCVVLSECEYWEAAGGESNCDGFAKGDGYPLIEGGLPYLICTADQLDNVRHYLEADFKLGADIDLKYYGDSRGFLPLSMQDWSDTGVYSYSGHFDGGNHTISNLRQRNLLGFHSTGLFGLMYGAVIDNLTLDSPQVVGKIPAFDTDYYGGLDFVHSSAGALASYAVFTDITKVNVVDGMVQLDVGSSSGSDLYDLGQGVAGGLLGTAKMSRVRHTNSSVLVRSAGKAGGLLGISKGSLGYGGYTPGHVGHSSASGDIEGNYFVGGLIGSAIDADTEMSYADGKVSGDSYVGGLVGNSWASWFMNTDSYGNLDATYNAGGLIGVSKSSRVGLSHAWGNLSKRPFVFDSTRYETTDDDNDGTYETDLEGRNFGGFIGTYYNSDTFGFYQMLYGSHAHGDVNGGTNVGGFIGFINSDADDNDYDSQILVIESSSRSNITGDDAVGGFVGRIGSTVNVGSNFTASIYFEDNLAGGAISINDSCAISCGIGGFIGCSTFRDNSNEEQELAIYVTRAAAANTFRYLNDGVIEPEEGGGISGPYDTDYIDLICDSSLYLAYWDPSVEDTSDDGDYCDGGATGILDDDFDEADTFLSSADSGEGWVSDSWSISEDPQETESVWFRSWDYLEGEHEIDTLHLQSETYELPPRRMGNYLRSNQEYYNYYGP